MVRSRPESLEDRIALFLERKGVAAIGEICSAVGRADITVKHALAKLDYITSYDQNSRFYALRSAARFDRHGIWRHRKASFTSRGTLADLLVALVDSSPRGCTSAELEATTGVRVRTVLAQLAKRGRLARVRQQWQYVCFSVRSKRDRLRQVKARLGPQGQFKYEEEGRSVDELKKTIAILLEIIRSQPRSQRELCERLSKLHPEILAGVVGEVVRRYDLVLKKKLDPYRIFDTVVSLANEFRQRSGQALVLNFHPERKTCPICGRPLAYFKTTAARSCQTLRYRTLTVRETQVRCLKHPYRPKDGSPMIHGSQFLRTLVQPGAPIGYDVIVEVGTKRFVEFLQVEEVVVELQRRGVSLSSSSVSRWADFFLAAVECLHFTKIKKLKWLIKRNGGYLLHIDCTTETNSDTVFVCMDRIVGVVLLSEKIPSESYDEAKRQLLVLKANFGRPLGIMRDMSSHFASAVEEVFEGVPDRICQFHFLRDIGRDLFGDLHVTLGQELTALKINRDLRKAKRELEASLPVELVEAAALEFSDLSAVRATAFQRFEAVLSLRLIEWVLDFTQDGDGLGFPFDLPRLLFYSRLNRIRLRLAGYTEQHPGRIEACPWLSRLEGFLGKIAAPPLRVAARELRSRTRAFDRLRSVLRFTVTSEAPLAETMSIGTLKEVRAYNRELLAYTKSLLARRRRGELTETEATILKHVEKYQFNLPIPEGLAEVLLRGRLDRTNNAEESLFRDIKRGQRRQSGKKDISREFSLYGPYLPLTKNLANEQYVATVIGRVEDLPLRISQLDPRDIEHYKQRLYESRRGKFFKHLKKIDAVGALS